MSVIDSQAESEENIAAILSELKMINEQHQQREKIYQECMGKFLNHLNMESEQLLNFATGIEKKNNNIRQSFETAYDTIFDGADRGLRSIRRTFEAKRKFWEETIEEFAAMDNLELKKELYALKRDAEEKFEDAIEARKQMKKIPFKRVFSKREADRSLANFQDINNDFEGKVYLGTNTTNRWRKLENTFFNSDNKQNENNAKNTYRPISKGNEQESILNQFVRK